MAHQRICNAILRIPRKTCRPRFKPFKIAVAFFKLKRGRTPGNTQSQAYEGDNQRSDESRGTAGIAPPPRTWVLVHISLECLGTPQPSLLQPSNKFSPPGPGWSLTLSRSSPSFNVGIEDAKLTLQFAPRISRPFACVPSHQIKANGGTIRRDRPTKSSAPRYTNSHLYVATVQ